MLTSQFRAISKTARPLGASGHSAIIMDVQLLIS